VNALTLNQTPTMSSREIAELTDKQHPHVKRDIEKMLTELGEDASKFGCIYLDSMNREQTEYHLNRELTDCLLTGYSAVARMRVIKRWHSLEAATRIPQDFESALRLAADQQREIKRQQQLLEDQAPKVALANAVVADFRLLSFEEAGKEFDLSARKLIQILHTAGWIFQRKQFDSLKPSVWQPSQKAQDRGLLVFKKRPDERGRLWDQTLVTGKGMAEMRKLFK